ncbi:hypothetical protein VST7929_02579 [Vibrio stylophorae]|uniref:Uncharacterized protein n=1 Tax=Vibrio stylophorae TaxID=659351 RepID=A0ABN8E0P6_9VIBR|nr:hypothetical protein [Vibrio stylophorae]CAH0534629.1 hypothetical protein VST7929_02579 [Vibrio stylophorae]
MMKKVFVAMMMAFGLFATGVQAEPAKTTAAAVSEYSQQEIQACGTSNIFQSCVAAYQATHDAK